jgi:hypothetical protein
MSHKNTFTRSGTLIFHIDFAAKSSTLGCIRNLYVVADEYKPLFPKFYVRSPMLEVSMHVSNTGSKTMISLMKEELSILAFCRGCCPYWLISIFAHMDCEFASNNHNHLTSSAMFCIRRSIMPRPLCSIG